VYARRIRGALMLPLSLSYTTAIDGATAHASAPRCSSAGRRARLLEACRDLERSPADIGNFTDVLVIDVLVKPGDRIAWKRRW